MKLNMQVLFSYYHEDFLTPNNSPLEAETLNTILDKRNDLKTLRERRLATQRFFIFVLLDLWAPDKFFLAKKNL